MAFPASLLLVGAGNMGGALLAAWRKGGMKADAIHVAERNETICESLVKDGVRLATLEDAPRADCIVLAVKPQVMDEALAPLAARQDAGTFYLSIAAGKTLGYFAGLLGEAAPVIRAMPNTPALIGKGISALCANANVTDAQKEQAETLLGAAGATVWVSEDQMDAVTAISGSGPAYMFLLLDALARAGERQGLSEIVSRQLAVATMEGSAALAASTDKTLEELRHNVTSPGGTTEAALRVLMQDSELATLIDDAVHAAVKRARELA